MVPLHISAREATGNWTLLFFFEDHCNILQEVLDKKAELEV